MWQIAQNLPMKIYRCAFRHQNYQTGDDIMSVAEEIREQQKQAFSTMNSKEKLAYFWDYYKIHVLVLIVVIVMVSTFIYQYVTNKDYGFYVSLVNAAITDQNENLASEWAAEFQEYAGIDPKEYQVYIDTSVILSEDMSSSYSVSNEEKMFIMAQVGTINAIIAETESFEKYSQLEYFYNLENVLSAEEIEKYRPYFYYTDAATFDTGDDDTFYEASEQKDPGALTINHRDPSCMEQPIAVGIILTSDNQLADAGYYAYLANDEHDYQGYPSETVLGIPVSSKEPELAVRFLEFLQLGDV